MDKLRFIAEHFNLKNNIISIKKYGNGLINNTYLVTTEKRKYILQKINTFVFKNPYKLMENINNVSKYVIKQKGNSLELIKTKDDLYYYQYENEVFRVYKMIEDAKSYEKLPNDKYALYVGKVIGEFQYLLKDFDNNTLNITIPFFHDLRHRYIDLIKAYRNCKDTIRKEDVKEYIAFVLGEYHNVMLLPILIEKDKIKKRVCHYDTKLNNFLFSKEHGNFLIDLDTVSSGCSLYDFGDCARNIIVNVEEDDYLSQIKINYKVLCCLIIGYLSIGKNHLSIIEINNLIESIKVITLELSIRFMTDYLEHDCYFKINYENQNLNRFICQLNIYKKLVSESDNMNELLNNIRKRLI